MAWLIIDECPDYPKTDVPSGERHAVRYPNGRTMRYEATRSAIERLYPERTIYTPLERAPQGSLVLFCYISPRQDGVGRIQCNFELWAVAP